MTSFIFLIPHCNVVLVLYCRRKLNLRKNSHRHETSIIFFIGSILSLQEKERQWNYLIIGCLTRALNSIKDTKEILRIFHISDRCRLMWMLFTRRYQHFSHFSLIISRWICSIYVLSCILSIPLGNYVIEKSRDEVAMSFFWRKKYKYFIFFLYVNIEMLKESGCKYENIYLIILFNFKPI